MGWLRHVIIDLAVTAVILAATVYYQAWAGWIVWIYTPFLLLLRASALWSGAGTTGASAPDWFYHVLYAVNVVLLLSQGWYWSGAGWIAIWGLSTLAVIRSRRTD